jgi:hypothetical protein
LDDVTDELSRAKGNVIDMAGQADAFELESSNAAAQRAKVGDQPLFFSMRLVPQTMNMMVAALTVNRDGGGE